MIKNIAFFIFPVQDMTRARKFYEDVIGLKPADRFIAPGNDDIYWVEYDVAGATLALSNQLPGPPMQGGGLAFEVDDLDAEFDRIKDSGITVIRPPFNSDRCRGVIFSDTEGNTIGFHQLVDASKYLAPA